MKLGYPIFAFLVLGTYAGFQVTGKDPFASSVHHEPGAGPHARGPGVHPVGGFRWGK